MMAEITAGFFKKCCPKVVLGATKFAEGGWLLECCDEDLSYGLLLPPEADAGECKVPIL